MKETDINRALNCEGKLHGRSRAHWRQTCLPLWVAAPSRFAISIPGRTHDFLALSYPIISDLYQRTMADNEAGLHSDSAGEEEQKEAERIHGGYSWIKQPRKEAASQISWLVPRSTLPKSQFTICSMTHLQSIQIPVDRRTQGRQEAIDRS